MSREDFCSDSFVQTILHVQQKFFMIDSLTEGSIPQLSPNEQQKLQKVLIISLSNNLKDFREGLEIEARYSEFSPAA